jgi:anti-sigma-K factor RskA
MADQFTELAESFVLGILDERESRQFAQHLATGCRECRRAVGAAGKVASLLPYLGPQNEPPPELKRRLLDAVAAEAPAGKMSPLVEKSKAAPSGPATIRPMPQRTFFQRTQGTLAWAAVFLLIAVGYGYIVQRGLITQLQQQLAAQGQQLNERQAEIKLLQFEMERQQTVIQQIQKSKASHLLLVNLQGTDVKPSGGVKVLLDPQTAGGSFIAYNLPPLADDHVYQLWFLKDDQPFDAGVFHVNERGDYIGEIQHLPETLKGVAAFAITREPQGGRPTPTMPIYWLGNMQGV